MLPFDCLIIHFYFLTSRSSLVFPMLFHHLCRADKYKDTRAGAENGADRERERERERLASNPFASMHHLQTLMSAKRAGGAAAQHSGLLRLVDNADLTSLASELLVGDVDVPMQELQLLAARRSSATDSSGGASTGLIASSSTLSVDSAGSASVGGGSSSGTLPRPDSHPSAAAAAAMMNNAQFLGERRHSLTEAQLMGPEPLPMAMPSYKMHVPPPVAMVQRSASRRVCSRT